jgi:protein TonB
MAQADEAMARHTNPHPLGGLVLLAACLAAGLCAALGLAWFMYVLIQSSEMQLAETDRARVLDFVRIKREETAARKDRKPERPKASEVPDIPPTDQSSDSGPQLALNVSSPTDMDADLDLHGGMATGDGDYLPIVKVAPIFPRAALSRGLKGECMVRYTVTTAGTVKDVEVINDECAQTVFRSPSVEAAKRFKYKPRMIDGVPVEVHGVRNRFYFDWEWAPGEENQ